MWKVQFLQFKTRQANLNTMNQQEQLAYARYRTSFDAVNCINHGLITGLLLIARDEDIKLPVLLAEQTGLMGISF